MDAANNAFSDDGEIADPFTFVHEDVNEIMFQHLNGKDVKQIHQVATAWNEIATKSNKCGSKLKLKVNCERNGGDENLELIAKISMIANRKYGALELLNYSEASEETKTLLLEAFGKFGSNVNHLIVNEKPGNRINFDDLVKLLQIFNNLENICTKDVILENESAINVNASIPLPKLKTLMLHKSSSAIYKLFSVVNSLTEISWLSIDIIHDTKSFEDFLIRQCDLKIIFLSVLKGQRLFGGSRVVEIKFHLESLSLVGFVFDEESVVDFFVQQHQTLTNVALSSFYDQELFPPEYRTEYSNILEVIFMLPNLTHLSIDTDDDTGETVSYPDSMQLKNCQNLNVKWLKYREQPFFGITSILNIFPNLEGITFQLMSTKSLNLTDVSSSKLKIIEIDEESENKLESFMFAPSMNDQNQEQIEERTLNFIRRHNTIKKLDIGYMNWNDLGFGLSLDFHVKVLEFLPQLDSLGINHPQNIKELVTLLINAEQKFKRVRIITNKSDYEFFQKEKDSSWTWLEICCIGEIVWFS
jgi:hypothetical protein